MTSLFPTCLAFFLFLVPSWALAETHYIQLNARFHLIRAEVAANESDRQQGLMFRKQMATNDGMLFVFPQSERYCMWMRNTLIPLSVAFLNEEGMILNIEDMQPLTEDTHCARAPARFALEMNLGWFAERGIQAGQSIGGLNHAPNPQ